MIKKLDILVIKAFIGPFIATFFITLLVLVMQFFWLYIDDFVGKGLGVGLILEFIMYQSTSLVPLALPLAVLLSSLMTFGNLGESYELVAVKSAGISLLRFMRPLFIVSLLISGLAFTFSNYIIPVSNLKSRTMLTDIVYAKPSFDLKEGVFYDKIPGFSIKIGKKEENDSVIRDIIIYEQKDYLQDNFIVASDGVMRVAANKRDLEFLLKNGWRYEERGTPPANTDYIRLGFKEYKKSFDLSSFGLQQRTADSVNKNNARMLSMRQLNVAIDSIAKVNSKIGNRVETDVMAIFPFTANLDSNWKTTKAVVKKKSFEAFIPDSIRNEIKSRAGNKIASMQAANEISMSMYKEQSRTLRLYKIEWHKKMTLSLACVVLFMIGAPLGSIIRKGGLGTPMVFAIAFFMVFYFSSTSGEKFAKEGSWGMIPGMWFSFLILIPVGVFLTYKAMNDPQVFSKDFYNRFLQKLPFAKSEANDHCLTLEKSMAPLTPRRKFITSSVKAGLGLYVGSGLLTSCATNRGATNIPSQYTTGFTQQPLPYGYDALEAAIDAKTMEIHYTKHAASYATNLNDAAKAEGVDASKPLEDLLRSVSKYSVKLRNNGGGHYNHELFWKCMSPKSAGTPGGNLASALDSSFGSFETFKTQFSDAGKNRFGSGWAWLVVDGDKRLRIGSTPNQDNPLMDASEFKGFPLLGLDVWEHAYYLRYQNKRPDYIAAWWKVVNWDYVAQRYQSMI